MANEKIKQLHQTAVDAIVKVKLIEKDHDETEEAVLTFGEKFANLVFRIVGSWTSIVLFVLFVVGWGLFNANAPIRYRFDPHPYSLITFLLAGIAAIQAPVIMISQQRQARKTSERLAVNLKVDNEILSLHQSITVLIEQQLQQVHENQLTTIKLLNGLHIKSDQQANTP
jgi:uncharacterized membrane protein